MTRIGPVAWLDFRPDDLTRAQQFIDSMSEEGVLDELGFLSLFGAFADVFYPATTTVMSSARYLYFVAGIYRQLEREKGVRSSNVAKEVRARQDRLRASLVAVEKHGVIGKEKKEEVKQLPSTIYWSSLRRLGFFKADFSERAYQDTFDDIKRARRGFSDDDEAAQSVSSPVFWDQHLPVATFLDDEGNPRSRASFTLTRAEARDLSQRFEAKFEHSLLVHHVQQRIPSCDRPWDAHRPSDYLRHHLELARKVSLFARGVTLHYYLLLLEARDSAKLSPVEDTVTPAFQFWWEEARAHLKGWDASELRQTPAVAPVLRAGTHGDLSFMSGWLDRLAASATPKAFLGDSAARERVRGRERAVKPRKARLKSLVHLKQWQIPPIGETVYQLDYRHGIGMQFVAEILTGLEGAR